MIMEPNLNSVLIALIGVVGSGFGAWLTYRVATIHKAVNSERSAMIAEVRRLNELVTKLSEKVGVV